METPTFYHKTVLLHEAVDGLDIKADGVYVDATFGGGGHSRLILERLGPGGKLIAFDHDADAWRNKPDDARLISVTESFRYMKRFLRLHGHSQVDGILADLGVSSWQFDTGERGFSTRFDGPLDMRMDIRNEVTAADIVRTYPEARLHKLFEEFGEVRNSRELARHLVAVRGKAGIATIGEFKSVTAPVVKGRPDKYYAQVFQALRIAVNEELQVLREFLEQVPACLKPGGRLSVISFHSGEDRFVKRFIRGGAIEETPDFLPQATPPPPLRALSSKPIEPTEEEIKENPRARSARLRVAEKRA